jgi:SecD/SecF fusion protein
VTTLTATGRFGIYDWERSVLGANGRPSPADPAVTGGPGAGQVAALTETEARSRADLRPGARALEADGGWFTLGGDPALTNTDVASARADKDPTTGAPVVAADLTPAGQRAFTTLTRELAERGADQSLGGDPLQSSQHLALVLDDRIISTPYINWRESPDGIDGAEGAYLSGLLTPEQAQLTAAVLNAGPLPAGLQPAPG